MENTAGQIEESAQQRLARWRAMHPELSDREFNEAVLEIQSYLKIVWRVFRARHKDEDLPDDF